MSNQALSLRGCAFFAFLLLFAVYGYVHSFGGWNPNSRLDLLHAVVVGHTLRIDAYNENTGDKAFVDGHFYSEKAPAVALMALPGFVAAAALLRGRLDVDSPQGWRISDWMTTAFSVGIITALGGAAFLLLLGRFIPARHSVAATAYLFLGTGLFAYATALFAHAAAGALLAVALAAIVPDDAGEAARHRAGFVAGFAAALAVASEYPMALGATGIGLFVIARRRRCLPAFLAGAILPLSIVPIYNVLCFGSPVKFGYVHTPFFPQMKQGFFGFHRPPSLSVMASLLFGPRVGLFFWSPFLLLGLEGYRHLWSDRRDIFCLMAGVPLLQVILISAYMWPEGGWTLGPRYLVGIVPFVGFAAGLGSVRWPRLSRILGGLSILLMGGATMITLNLPQEVARPLFDFYWPKLIAGQFTANLGKAAGLPSLLSLIPPLILAGVGFFRLSRRAPAS